MTRWSRLSGALRASILERDGAVCRCCGAQSELCIDHIVPVSKGGPDDESNLQVLCHRCNAGKGNRAACRCNGRHSYPPVFLGLRAWPDRPDFVQVLRWHMPNLRRPSDLGYWYSPTKLDREIRDNPITIEDDISIDA